jgi:hypothetical protein
VEGPGELRRKYVKLRVKVWRVGVWRVWRVGIGIVEERGRNEEPAELGRGPEDQKKVWSAESGGGVWFRGSYRREEESGSREVRERREEGPAELKES